MLPTIPLYVFDPASGALISTIRVAETDLYSWMRTDTTDIAPPAESASEQACFIDGAWVLMPRQIQPEEN